MVFWEIIMFQFQIITRKNLNVKKTILRIQASFVQICVQHMKYTRYYIKIIDVIDVQWPKCVSQTIHL